MVFGMRQWAAVAGSVSFGALILVSASGPLPTAHLPTYMSTTTTMTLPLTEFRESREVAPWIMAGPPLPAASVPPSRPAVVRGPGRTLSPPKVVRSSPPSVPAPLQPWLATYQTAAATWHVPWALLAAQGYVESRWDPTCSHVDPNGSVDRGIAQINSVAWPTVSNAEAYSPVWAINWQAHLLSTEYAHYRSWTTALEVYNAGHPLSALPPAEQPAVAQYAATVHHWWATLATPSP